MCYVKVNPDLTLGDALTKSWEYKCSGNIAMSDKWSMLSKLAFTCQSLTLPLDTKIATIKGATKQ